MLGYEPKRNVLLILASSGILSSDIVPCYSTKQDYVNLISGENPDSGSQEIDEEWPDEDLGL